jgi:hypothetical protein
MFGLNVRNRQSKSRDVDGTDRSLALKQAAYEDLTIPYGEFGVLFLSAVLVVIVLLGGFSASPTERNKGLGAGLVAFLSDSVGLAVEPANVRSRGSKGSSARYASRTRGRTAHKYRHHDEIADQRARQLVRVQTVDCSDPGKNKAANGVRPQCELAP